MALSFDLSDWLDANLSGRGVNLRPKDRAARSGDLLFFGPTHP